MSKTGHWWSNCETLKYVVKQENNEHKVEVIDKTTIIDEVRARTAKKRKGGRRKDEIDEWKYWQWRRGRERDLPISQEASKN